MMASMCGATIYRSRCIPMSTLRATRITIPPMMRAQSTPLPRGPQVPSLVQIRASVAILMRRRHHLPPSALREGSSDAATKTIRKAIVKSPRGPSAILAPEQRLVLGRLLGPGKLLVPEPRARTVTVLRASRKP